MREEKTFDLSRYMHGVVPGKPARERGKPTGFDMSKYVEGLVPRRKIEPIGEPPAEMPTAAPGQGAPQVQVPEVPEVTTPAAETPELPPTEPLQREGAGAEETRRDAEQAGGEFVPVLGDVIPNWTGRQHGVTVRARQGTPVRSIRAGTVEYSQMSDIPGYGNLVIINHGDGRRSLYAYAGDRMVSPGDTVERGQQIATVGSSGALEEPALYFEEWQDRNKLDSSSLFAPREAPTTGGERVALPPTLERKLTDPGEQQKGFFRQGLEETARFFRRAGVVAGPGGTERRATSAEFVTGLMREALEPVGEAYTRPAAGWLQAKLRRAPSTEEIVAMMREAPKGQHIPELNRLAREGLLPDVKDVPTDAIAGLKSIRAGNLLEPSASRVRSGREVGLVPEQFKGEHPVLAVVPAATQKALSEMFVKPYVLYPQQAPTELAIDLVGGVIIGKGAKLARASLGKMTKGSWIGLDVTGPLRNFLKSSNVTLDANTWRKFVYGSSEAGQIPDDVARALGNLTDDHLDQIADALADVGAGDTAVTITVPRGFRGKALKPKIAAAKPKRPVPLEALDFDEIWSGDFALRTPDAVIPSDAQMAQILEDVPQSVIGALRSSRRAVRATDEEVLRNFGKAVGKQAQADALARRYGADVVLDAIEEAGMRATPRETALETWTRETRNAVLEEMRAAGERGLVRVRRGPTPPEITSDELRQALYRSRTSRGHLNRFGGWIRDKAREIRDLVTIEHEPDLVRARQMQFRDDLRTELIPVWHRAGEEVALQLDHNIFGPLNGAETDQLLNIMGMRSFLQSSGEGLKIPRNLTREVVEAELEKQVRWASAKSPKVIKALQRYEEYSRLVGQDLVRRGKMSAEDLKDFYFPHLILDHLPEWWYRGPFAKKRLRDPFRPYIKERVGSLKDIAIDKQALLVHYATVSADNKFDDAAQMLLKKYDELPGIPKATKQMLFGKRMTPRPGRAYKVTVPGPNGEPVEQIMRGIQYKPGNVVYRTFAVDEKLLAQSLEDALLMEPHEAELVASAGMEEILKFLEDVGPRGGNAIREALAIGGYNKTFLVPEPIYNKLIKLRDPAMQIPGLYTLMGITSFWKRFTLSPFGAGLPFQVANFIGDSEALYRTAPRAVSEIPTALKVMWNLNPAKQRHLWGELTDFEREVTQIVLRKDVLGSGFMREYANIAPLDPRKWMKMYERVSSLREALLRVAMTSHQWRRYKAGKSFIAPEFKHIIAGLDPESAAAYVGRNFAVDYLAVPDFYRRYGRGLLVPFGTFWQRNAANYAAYLKGAPGWFTAKFVAPRVALWYHNNHGDPTDPKSPVYTEERLPDWIRQRTHINFPAFDKDGDGEPDTSYIIAPELPFDMAARFLGLDTIGEKVTLMRQHLITPQQAAKQMLWDIGVGPLKVGHDLLSPMAKIMEAWMTNRDPFTNQRIVPEGFEDVPEVRARRYGEFMVGQLLTPVGHLIGTMREGAPISEALARRVDLFRGMGLREVNLKAEEARDMMRVARDTRAIISRSLWKLENEYVTGDAEPEEFFFSEKARSFQQEALDQQVFVTPLDVLEILMSPRVRSDRLRTLMRREKDPQKKAALLQEYNQLLKLRAWDYIHGSPRAARIAILERIMESQHYRSAEDVFDYSGTPAEGRF